MGHANWRTCVMVVRAMACHVPYVKLQSLWQPCPQKTGMDPRIVKFLPPYWLAMGCWLVMGSSTLIISEATEDRLSVSSKLKIDLNEDTERILNRHKEVECSFIAHWLSSGSFLARRTSYSLWCWIWVNWCSFDQYSCWCLSPPDASSSFESFRT